MKECADCGLKSKNNARECKHCDWSFGRKDYVTVDIPDNHYRKHPSGIEAIEVVKYENFNIGNAFKYLFRRRFKGNEVRDLEKAVYYIKEEIAMLVQE